MTKFYPRDSSAIYSSAENELGGFTDYRQKVYHDGSSFRSEKPVYFFFLFLAYTCDKRFVHLYKGCKVIGLCGHFSGFVKLIPFALIFLFVT